MITFSYDCPYCMSKNVAFEVGDFGCRERQSAEEDVFAILATCNNCGCGIVSNVVVSNTRRDLGYRQSVSEETLELLRSHQNKKYSLREVFPNQKMVFYPVPPKPDIPEHLPEDVLPKMRAAETLYIQAKGNNDLLESAGTTYRKTLEFALAHLDKNSGNKSLYQRIKSLGENRVLVKPMVDFAHSIRALGNEATHSDFCLEELTDLRLFTQLFLQYTFTLPAKMPDKVKAD